MSISWLASFYIYSWIFDLTATQGFRGPDNHIGNTVLKVILFKTLIHITHQPNHKRPRLKLFIMSTQATCQHYHIF